MRIPARYLRSRGMTAVIAMLFLMLSVTLGLAMYAATTSQAQSASNMTQAERARQAAESGLRWASWRFTKMARPKTAIGNITATVAASLWPSIRTSITNDYATMLSVGERAVTWDGSTLASSNVAVDGDGATFAIQYRLHPLYAGDPLDARYLHVTSTGTYRGATRTLSMDFSIDKKVKFAIVGKVPIQLGRNTLVEGPIGMATPGKYPPLYMLSDFRHLDSTMAAWVDGFNAFLKANHKGYDNRVSALNSDEWTKAINAGYADTNDDGYIDEYDLFVRHFDKNSDGAITKAEFTDPATGKLYDSDLFTAIDSLGAPQFTDDPQRAGFQDGVIDNRDGYSKIRGQVAMATTAASWQSNLGSTTKIQDMMPDPIAGSDSTEMPVKFGASSSDIFDLDPANFDTSTFRNQTGPENGSTATSGGAQVTIANKVLSVSDAQVIKVTNRGSTSLTNGGVYLKSDFDAANAGKTNKATGTNISTANAVEHTPYGSTSYQATYNRPVFKNMHFVNVRIPKGMNALFENCTFDGVTYVDLVTTITNSGGATTTNPNDGKTWSQKMKSGSFSADTTLTSSNSYGYVNGNNLRFDNCTIKGPLASDVPTAYTHFTNSWEFTGSTYFDLNQDPNKGPVYDTATIVAPQTNIEMGSFTDPNTAPSTLVGVVVAGNLDVRGSSIVDGSVIVTGDGAGNTTMGWFGPNDATTDPSSAMPEGGWGRLNLRYNPTRVLPDGINIAIDILPIPDTYEETQ